MVLEGGGSYSHLLAATSARCLLIPTKFCGLMFSKVCGLAYAQVSYFTWFGGPPDGRDDIVFDVSVADRPWRESLRRFINTRYIILYT